MPWCVAVGCSNDKKETKDGKPLSYHRFPHSNKEILSKWISNMKRKGHSATEAYQPSKTSTLCSEHFEPDCFQEDLYDKYVGRAPGRKPRTLLKPDAVPTLFQHNQDKAKPRTTSLRRDLAKQKSEVRT